MTVRGRQAAIVLSEAAIFSSVSGVSTIDGGPAISFGDNRINGNTLNGASTSSARKQ